MKTYKQYYSENAERLRKRNREYYYSHKESFIRRKRKSYEKIITIKKELGGRCSICGYNKSLYALQFHHKDINEKDFNISYMSHKPIEQIREEAKKTILICSNCHFEIHHPE